MSQGNSSDRVAHTQIYKELSKVFGAPIWFFDNLSKDPVLTKFTKFSGHCFSLNYISPYHTTLMPRKPGLTPYPESTPPWTKCGLPLEISGASAVKNKTKLEDHQYINTCQILQQVKRFVCLTKLTNKSNSLWLFAGFGSACVSDFTN